MRRISEDPLAAARRYIALGWSVMTLHTPGAAGCSCPKRAPCPSPGKHPPVDWNRARARHADA
jgi:hypothetical protein